jgi:hypothetical protein
MKCIRISLLGAGGGNLFPFAPAFSSLVYIAVHIKCFLATRTFWFYVLERFGSIAVLLLNFEANGRFEETTGPTTRYVGL